MASTEMLKVTPDTAMSSSWSGESLSKWISLSNHGEEHTSSSARPGTEDQAVTSLHDDQSHSVQTAHYPSTHYSYSHPELNPTSYQLTLPAIQPSPLSEGTISPTSQSEVYISSSSSANITSSINGHNGVVPMSWNHAVPGPGLPDELSSPRGNPLYLPYSHPDASPSSPFLSAVHSPASGSPGTHMITLLPPAHSLPAHTERPPLPQEHYVNLSDVAGDTASTPQIHGYHPHHHHHNDSDNIVYGTLQDGSRFENKRAREEDYPEDHIVPNKRSRGRPRKNSIHMSNSNTSFSSGNRSSGDGTEDMGGDGDSDAYVPSRSTSPRARGRRSTKRVSDSSYESSGGEHYQDGVSQFDYSYEGNVSNISKKSRGRKVPVDQGTIADVYAYVGGGGPSDSSVPGFDLNSPSLYTLPDTSTSAYSLRPLHGSGDLSQHDGQPTHFDYAAQPSMHDHENGVEYTAPRHGRPPARGRGRYAHASDVRVVNGGIKKSSGDRRYVCTAPGCGKCFVRGEHLKRHVRSLHSAEKPHKCLHPGCNKSFSRRDNLGQHARVHL